ncbi:MAG: 4-(cytidine 5'-diphospho)-2-C-methyl-D-erythritol kinase [Xanthomonadales bacterium]|nr:4-(cytidine 5'-diphospho)-2-C-methyl-D-erythritol kinase [Xanthomonadales bacterium]
MTAEPGTGKQAWPAPAKINLFLHITGRRADGYHDLQTLFQILGWGDVLRFTINDSGRVSRHCNIDSIPEATDICVRAARLLQRTCTVKSGAHIDLTKRIPTGAGLGGGSSDAATTLLVLNHLWGCGLAAQQLAELGLQLGADVPVFIHGHSAWAEGRGERLEAVELGQRHYVLVFPEFGISTAEVFRHPDLKRDSPPVEIQDTGLAAGDNDCESVARKLHPELAVIMQDLAQWGQPRMSGTGSTIFLEFADKMAANSAASELKCRYNVRAVEGVDRSPLLDSLSASGDSVV